MTVKTTHVLLGAAVGAAAALTAIAGVSGPPNTSPGVQPRPLSASASSISSPVSGAPMSFADIFERVSPAVVSINVTSHADPAAMRRLPGFENFPFDLVPRDRDGDQPRRAPKQLSAGSGFFISPDGYIVTNNHVVQGADEIRVVLKDGKELKATIVGRDEPTDLAVIKVGGHGYSYVDFEQTSRPRVGDWVLAVGNPFSLGSTATAGIVSAYNRDLGESFVDYIQIDAPINRGNSGGPTFDMYGRVIGVNTAIFSPSGGSVGIGFDIPADVAASVTRNLMAGQPIRRGYIGATIQTLTDELADSWGLHDRKGAVVADLVPGGPAARAGLQQGDVVVAVNGNTISNNSEMTREVAKTPAGRIARLTVFRDGREREVDVQTALRPTEEQLAANGGTLDEGQNGANPSGAKARPNAMVLGMYVVPLNPMTRQQYSVTGELKGVVIDSVASTSDASDKGLRRGDVITRAGDRPVLGASDIVGAVADWRKAGRQSIPLSVNHDGRNVVVPIKIEG